MDLLKLITELRNKYTDPIDTPDIEGWEKQVKRLLLVEAIADSEAITVLTTSLQSEVDSLDTQLLTSDSHSLSDYERDRVIDKKMLYLSVIDYFNVTDARKTLEDQLKKQ